MDLLAGGVQGRPLIYFLRVSKVGLLAKRSHPAIAGDGSRVGSDFFTKAIQITSPSEISVIMKVSGRFTLAAQPANCPIGRIRRKHRSSNDFYIPISFRSCVSVNLRTALR